MDHKKKNLIVLSVLIGIVALVGVSYALWIANFNQTDENLVSASCFQIEFREDTQSISLQNTFPITDEEGKNLLHIHLQLLILVKTMHLIKLT